MKLYNTMTKKKEEFKPLIEGEVKMYSCGPTVYNFFHIGNSRPFIIFDALRRYLEYRGYKVTFVQNFTDIDDKIIRKAKEEGVNPKELSEKYINEYFKDVEGLNIRKADFHPKVTEHIQEVINVIKMLEENELTYNIDGDVYYDTSKFEGYGKLSKQNLEELEAGARVDINDVKKNPTDFSLWKKQKQGEPAWESPWGLGRPGWHIECSAMCMKYLGETIDIHSGGQDLVFPHHENEIAQSEGATGKQFVRYWLHNGFLNINNEKMSKSLGNFSTVRDIGEKYDLEIVRMFMLSAHYRNPINFSSELLDQTKNGLERLYNVKNNLTHLLDNVEDRPLNNDEIEFQKNLGGHKAKFMGAMDDDLNTADAIAAIYDMIRDINSNLKGDSAKEIVSYSYNILMELSGVLGLLQKKEDNLDNEIEQLIADRQQARKEKNWSMSDKIRDDLKARGIVLEDTPQGVKWKKI